MKKEMLINVMQPEECRIAIVEDGVLEELYVERTSQESYVGNIYKGRIVNIEPSIQAAFVDFGIGRNGFLHVSDVEPAYYRHIEQRRGNGGDRDHGRDRDHGPGRDRDHGPGRDRGRRGPGPRDRDRDRGRGDHGRDRDRRPQRSSEGPSAPPSYPSPEREAEERGMVEADFPLTDVSALELAPSPESALAAESAEPHPRGRGRARRRREDPREPEAGPERGEAPVAEPAGEAPPSEPPPEKERTRFMDSAERRTEEDDPRHEPLEPAANVSDDEIFFPRVERETPPAGKTVSPALPPAAAPPALEPWEEPAHADPMLPIAVERLVGEFEEAAPRHIPEPAARPVRDDDDFEDTPLATEDPFPIESEDDGSPEQPASHRLDDRVHDQLLDEREDDDMAEERLSAFDEEEEGGEEGGEQRRRGPREAGGRRPFRGRRMGGGRPGMGRPKPLIQEIFRRGQEVLVQVIKEGIGTKGPTLTTYISIAGRYLVLMPHLNRVGVSRKINDDDARRRLREIFHELQPPRGLGFIIRTAGMDKTKKELQRDLAYLSRVWQVVVRRIRKTKAPAEIYQESDMITRTIRDTFTNDIDTIWVDEHAPFEQAQEFMSIVMPRYANRIKEFTDPEPLFYKYGIEDEIARIQRRHVPLPAGGSIVVDQTEAMVAIDVNSGNFRADNNAEETAYQMNLVAAKEIARQLRLRDLGGVIVNDFIDMRDEKHRRGVERALRDAVKRDRARTKILKISAFGLIEMTRQRIRPSLKRSVYRECPCCQSTGQVKTTESMSIEVMRMVQLASNRENIYRVEIKVAEEVANYLLNKKRKEIARLEETGEIAVTIHGLPGAMPETRELLCYDNNNSEVKFLGAEEPPRPRGRNR